MKYKVGDSVTIRRDLKVGKEYGSLILYNNMSGFLGRIGRIAEISGEGNYFIFGRYWSSEMFEPSRLKVKPEAKDGKPLIVKWTPIKKGLKKYNAIFEVEEQKPIDLQGCFGKKKISRKAVDKILRSELYVIHNKYDEHQIEDIEEAVTKIMRLIK